MTLLIEIVDKCIKAIIIFNMFKQVEKLLNLSRGKRKYEREQCHISSDKK